MFAAGDDLHRVHPNGEYAKLEPIVTISFATAQPFLHSPASKNPPCFKTEDETTNYGKIRMTDQWISLLLIVGCGLLVLGVWAFGLAYFTAQTRRDPELSMVSKLLRYLAVAFIVGAWLYSVWEKTFH
jgi:hypothetical protein